MGAAPAPTFDLRKDGVKAYRAGDNRRAMELYRQGCDGGSAGGCTNLGLMYEGGQGGLTKDDRRAVELYRQACDAGAQPGCNNLARLDGG